MVCNTRAYMYTRFLPPLQCTSMRAGVRASVRRLVPDGRPVVLRCARSFSDETQINIHSSQITQPPSQGASQAMLYATGLNEEQLKLPQVGIASVWWEGNPCNMHLLDLSERVKEGCTDAGTIGLRFNTIGVSDAISMGTSGMSYSLPSRDIIADSIETVMRAQWYDANICIPGCDKVRGRSRTERRQR